MEGGYKIHGGIVSPFARSVASHVRALVEGGSSREQYNAEDGQWESEFERNMVLEKDRRRHLRLEKIRGMVSCSQIHFYFFYPKDSLFIFHLCIVGERQATIKK